MNTPTAFGVNGNNMMIGGEAGAEAILPLSQLWNQLGRNFDKLEQKLSNNQSTVIEITNTTIVDGIVTKTTKEVMKTLNRNQNKLNKMRGVAVV